MNLIAFWVIYIAGRIFTDVSLQQRIHLYFVNRAKKVYSFIYSGNKRFTVEIS